MTKDQFIDLIVSYGNACADFGDYKSTINASIATKLEQQVLEEIAKLYEKIEKQG